MKLWLQLHLTLPHFYTWNTESDPWKMVQLRLRLYGSSASHSAHSGRALV